MQQGRHLESARNWGGEMPSRSQRDPRILKILLTSRIVFSATLSDFTLHLHKVHWMINTHEETSVILSLSHPPTACPAGGPSTLTQAAHLICYHYSVTGIKKMQTV